MLNSTLNSERPTPLSGSAVRGDVGPGAMGGKDRAQKQPWIPLALVGKATADALQAAKLTYDQWEKHEAFCIWCLVAAGATFATLPLVMAKRRQRPGNWRGRFDNESRLSRGGARIRRNLNPLST